MKIEILQGLMKLEGSQKECEEIAKAVIETALEFTLRQADAQQKDLAEMLNGLKGVKKNESSISD